MTKEEVCQLFMAGIDCSQVVTGACAEKMGMTKEQARKMSACFGGGMMCGETCGAVTGALMVLGMAFGHSEENDGDQKGIMAGKVAEFKKRFLEKYPSDMCREILGHDISKPGEMDKVLEKGLMFDLCPQIRGAGVNETGADPFYKDSGTGKDKNPVDALFFTKAVRKASYLFSERYQ